MAKAPTYNKKAVDKQLTKNGVVKSKAKNLTHKIIKGHQKTDEAATEAGLDDNKPIIVKGVKGMKSTAFTKKFRNMAAYDKWTDSDAFGDYDVQQIMNEGAPTTAAAASKRNQAAKERNMRRAKAMMKKGFSAEQAAKEHDLKPSDLKEANMAETKYGVFSKGGSIGSQNAGKKPMSVHDSKEEAQEKAKRLRKQLSPGEKSYYKMSYTVKPIKESQLNEGVLDDMDDDGFMAKRQLYDLAKYSVELHRMIQDTDNLEPWVQAKITKAADYIDTVKHYMEYQGVRDSEQATIDFNIDDIADVEDTLGTVAPEEQIEEVDDGMNNAYWEGQEAFLNLNDINPYPTGSQEANEWDEGYNHAAMEKDMMDDELNVYEAQARDIYNNMIHGLKGKK